MKNTTYKNIYFSSFILEYIKSKSDLMVSSLTENYKFSIP